MQATGNNSVYFIGAGLSRSLQLPDYPIPLMGDFMQVMAHYAVNRHDAVIGKLLALAQGAGEGRCLYCSESEEAKVAAGEYWKIIGSPAPSDLERCAALRRLAAAVCSRDPESVEDLLRRADNPEEPNRAAAGGGPGRLAQQFRYAIAKLFYLLRSKADMDPLERFLRARFALGGGHDFVSFNYDLFLDQAVQSCAGSRWNPSTGYGFQVGHSLRADPEPVTAAGGGGAAAPAPHTAPLENRHSHFRILKPHGSVNWLMPFRYPYGSGGAGLVFEPNGPVIVPLDYCGRLRNCNLEGDFNRVCWGLPHQTWDVGVYIVPPADSAKAAAPPRPLGDLPSWEAEAVRQADEVFVIGWSAPQTDQGQIRIIKSAARDRLRGPLRVTLVSLRRDDGLRLRVADAFGVAPDSVEAHWDGFRAFVDRVVPAGA